MNTNEWVLCYLLPHIKHGVQFENEHLAIVNHLDPRFRQIRLSCRASDVIFRSVVDSNGNQQCPSALIAKRGVSFQMDAILSFRNIIALSTICKSYSHFPGTFSPLFTEYFDFHWMQPGADCESILGTRNFTHHFLSADSAIFRGKASLIVSQNSAMFGDYDEALAKDLLKFWTELYIEKNPDKSLRRLFRSLHFAFKAGRYPNFDPGVGNGFDFGVSIGLWVSAIENLLHPGNDKGIYLIDILEELQKLDLFDEELSNQKYTIRIRNEKQFGIVPLVYHELYQARNAFLHGNEIEEYRLHPFCDPNQLNLLACAAVLFRCALAKYSWATPALESPDSQDNHYSLEEKIDSAISELKRRDKVLDYVKVFRRIQDKHES